MRLFISCFLLTSLLAYSQWGVAQSPNQGNLIIAAMNDGQEVSFPKPSRFRKAGFTANLGLAVL